MPDDYRREVFRETHAVVKERFGPGVAPGMRPGQRMVAALIRDDRYDDLVAYAEWEAGVRPRATPAGVEWHDGSLRVRFTAEYTDADGPLTVRPDGPRPPADEAPADLAEAVSRLTTAAADGFGRATADLILRDRETGASYFQPVETDRERVPAADGRTRLVLRGTATVDPATAAGGGPLTGGLWDAHVRLTLGGWTKECRLGPAPAQGGALPPAGLVDGRVVLPYWTKGYTNLSLDVDRAVKSLGLHRLTSADAALSDSEVLSLALPLHVPDRTAIPLRLTNAASGRTLDAEAVLTPADGAHGLLAARVPVRELRNAAWRTALLLPGGRALPLPLLLRAGRDDVRVVRVAPRGLLRRLLGRARRVLGGVLGPTTTRKA
ncbi:glycosyltransferase family 2 protein, partial [Streptomyces sp. SAS_269]